MKIAILGAVHGTTENDRLIFETFKAAVECKFDGAKIVTPDTIFAHKDKFLKEHKGASETEVLADMVKFDLEEVRTSDLVLADVSLRSTGLGLELGTLIGEQNKLLLFCKSDCGYSDMIKGAFPMLKVNIYNDPADLAEMLDKILK